MRDGFVVEVSLWWEKNGNTSGGHITVVSGIVIPVARGTGYSIRKKASKLVSSSALLVIYDKL